MEAPRHWRTQEARYRLVAGVCGACNALSFPRRERCATCRGAITRTRLLTGSGTVYSYSVVFQPPQGFLAHTPYVVAWIRLDEGPLVTAQLTDVDPGDVAIDMEVEMVLRRLREESSSGLVLYGYKFRPKLTGESAGSMDAAAEGRPESNAGPVGV